VEVSILPSGSVIDFPREDPGIRHIVDSQTPGSIRAGSSNIRYLSCEDERSLGEKKSAVPRSRVLAFPVAGTLNVAIFVLARVDVPRQNSTFFWFAYPFCFFR
jgi:hypothetical protein